MRVNEDDTEERQKEKDDGERVNDDIIEERELAKVWATAA